MEKTWEAFWTTGKVTDYLTYRNSVESDSFCSNQTGQRDQGNGTVRDHDGYGFDSHARSGL